MLKKIALAAAVVLGLAAPAAYPLGFGQLQVHSALGQPLDADVALTDVAGQDIDSLTVSIPSAEEFEKAGLRRSPVLDRVHLKLVQKNGKAYVHLSTQGSVNQPYLDLLLRVASPTDIAVDELSAFLSPEGFVTASPAMPETTAPPVVPETTAPVVATPPAAPPAPVTVKPPAAAVHDGNGLPATYGPVRRSQTLWSIAQSFEPEQRGVTMEQMVMGIYSHNPDSFDGGINDLRAGTMLNVPGVPVLTSIDQARARAEVRRQIRAFRERRGSSQTPAPKGGRLVLTAPEQAPVTGGGGRVTIPEAALKALLQRAHLSPGNPFRRMAPPLLEPAPSLAEGGSLVNASPMEAQQFAYVDESAESGIESATEAEPSVAQAAVADTETAADAHASAAAVAAEEAPASTGGAGSIEGSAAAAVQPQASSLSASDLRLALMVLAIVALVAVVLVWLWTRWYNRVAPAPAVEREPAPVAAHASPDLSGRPETVESTAGADEPDAALAEADFNIAYHLYDKALAGLAPVIMAHPRRADLRMKELEALRGTNDVERFAERARELRDLPDVSDADWAAVAAMGAELAPADELFEGGRATEAVEEAIPPTADAEPAGSMETVVREFADTEDIAGQSASSADEAPTELAEDMAIEDAGIGMDAASIESDDELPAFDVADIEDDRFPQEVAMDTANTVPEVTALEFDLPDVSLDPESEDADTMADGDVSYDDPVDALDFSIDESPVTASESEHESTDAETSFAEFAAAQEAESAISGGADDDSARGEWDVDFGDPEHLELGGHPSEDAMSDVEQDMGIKLDLARAYLAMNDREMALGLVDEVLEQGTTAQREEAEALKSQM